jgi:SPP1 family phage portal protein
MNLKRIKNKIIDSEIEINNIKEAKKYYKNENLILEKGVSVKGSPIRNADNRIPHNFHEILTDEKASYLFTYPVLIDVDGNTSTNEKVMEVLTDDFPRKIKNQCIEATNGGTSWIHYWKKEDVAPVQFKYALVSTEEIIPLYSNGLERDLESIIRHYTLTEYNEVDEEDVAYKYIEYWTNKDWTTWKIKASDDISVDNCVVGYPLIVNHALEEVPFIEFANNSKKQSDLAKYKRLIDLYDRVMSGFANDLDDIQEIIYILKGYGGQDLGEFLGDLKTYKAIKTDGEGNTGVETLQIDIPVEARKLILEILKKQIFESGQGLPQDIGSVANTSTTTLKFFYRQLELKSGLTETEFRGSISKLVKAILKHLNLSHTKINQTWTRNMISNDLEMAQICKESDGIIPDELILRYHPLVDDLEEAKKLKQEEKDEQNKLFEYNYSNLDTKKEADLVE